jgi:hypothetical protein
MIASQVVIHNQISNQDAAHQLHNKHDLQPPALADMLQDATHHLHNIREFTTAVVTQTTQHQVNSYHCSKTAQKILHSTTCNLWLHI